MLARALEPEPPVIVLCDGDLGESARELPALVAAVREGDSTWRSPRFRVKVGGGFGFAVRFSRWATRRLTGLELAAPISGQRALRGQVLAVVVPFGARFGMETAMNIDAARAGFRVGEIELDSPTAPRARRCAGSCTASASSRTSRWSISTAGRGRFRPPVGGSGLPAHVACALSIRRSALDPRAVVRMTGE